jgi:hypothetical protein
MTQSSETSTEKQNAQQDLRREAVRRDDVVRLLSSDEIAEAADFYDRAPCTD